jgi:hypothetical protein
MAQKPLNVKKIDKLIKKLDPKDIKSTMSLIMFICDIIEKTHNAENTDKIQLFLSHSDAIAQKLVDAKLISQDLVKDLDKYTDIVEDFYKLWGKTKHHCLWICKSKT